ncbi:MAG: hypothetical protein AAGK00_11800 [Pseudomonadota bacterium]
MTDVLKLALERRSVLKAEMAKIDEFIRMAEVLIKDGPDEGASTNKNAIETPSRASRAHVHDGDRRDFAADDSFSAPTRPQVIRRAQAAGVVGG